MGMISITFAGSFPRDLKLGTKTFSAEDGGHADAVSQAIAFLAGEAMGTSIQLDHALAKGGQQPKRPFGTGRDDLMAAPARVEPAKGEATP